MINPIRQGMAIERRTLENRIRQDIVDKAADLMSPDEEIS